MQDRQQETPRDFTISDKCVGRRGGRQSPYESPSPLSQLYSPHTAFLLEATSQTPFGGVQNCSDLSHNWTRGQQLWSHIPDPRLMCFRVPHWLCFPSAQSPVHLLRHPLGHLLADPSLLPAPFTVGGSSPTIQSSPRAQRGGGTVQSAGLLPWAVLSCAGWPRPPVELCEENAPWRQHGSFPTFPFKDRLVPRLGPYVLHQLVYHVIHSLFCCLGCK